MKRTSWIYAMFIMIAAGCSALVSAQEQNQAIEFRLQESELQVVIDQQTVARYVFRDPEVSHPYFVDVRTLAGEMVTRPHPPAAGPAGDDHLGLHTGIWMSFGDLAGNDYWRLKSQTEFIEFTQSPSVIEGSGHFTCKLQYLNDSHQPIIEAIDRFQIDLVEDGYRITWSSEFRPLVDDVAFGDQEEMGLAIRVAAPLVVQAGQGGRMLDDQGRRNGSEIWGQTVTWCDYAGPGIHGWMGMTVMNDTSEVGPCWCHARDYGFLAMNPFGKQAFTAAETPGRFVVQTHQTLTLRYAIVVHQSATEADFDPAEADRTFREMLNR